MLASAPHDRGARGAHVVGGAMGASRDGGRTLEPVVLIVIQCGGQKSYSVSRRLVRLRNRLGAGAAPGGSFRLVHSGNFQRKSGRKSKKNSFKLFVFTFAFADPWGQKSSKRVTGTLANTRAPPSRPRPVRPGVPHPEVPGAPGALREERGNVARHDRDYPGSKTASEH